MQVAFHFVAPLAGERSNDSRPQTRAKRSNEGLQLDEAGQYSMRGVADEGGVKIEVS